MTLAILLDLYNREQVVGCFQNDPSIDHRCAVDGPRTPEPGKGLLHHTDRGSQCASNDYQKILKKHGFICSMSRKGNCYDNAVAESFLVA
ncbi:MAG: hypothetical protein DSY90_11435 [Deltaproteobacteria bacterium]|nr:MAG: hypothetical protein DSY90_11435 [Deltaproteobacteria bacterium]